MRRLTVLFFILALVLAVTGLVLLFVIEPSDEARLADVTEVAKWLMTLSAGIATAGAVAGVFKAAEAERARRDAWAAQLDELMASHDAVQVARLRVKAHQTARTYSQQISELAEVRARLRRIGDDAAVVEVEGLRGDLKTMWKYLEALGLEYEKHYLRVARQQRADEAWLAHLVKEHANDPHGLPDEFFLPTRAGRALRDSGDFEKLRAFTDDKAFEAGDFRRGFEAARETLKRLAGYRS